MNILVVEPGKQPYAKEISGEVVYNYDRGLDVPPQNEAAEMALAILMHEYN